MATLNNRQTTLNQDQKMIAGVQGHLADKSFIVGDKSYAAKDVIAVYQGRVTTGQAVVTAHAAWLAAVKADRDERAQTAVFAGAFRTIVQGMYQDPGTLADFGLAPRKSTKKTVETKSTAVAKTLATRKARGTMGKKQKSKIKGDVTALPSQDGSSAKAPATSTATTPAAPVATKATS
jgi:hypothetical protein